MTTRTHIGFAKNVVPEWSFALPTRGCDANLFGGKRRDSDVARHSLARRQSDALTPLKITHGKRIVLFHLAFTGDGHW